MSAQQPRPTVFVVTYLHVPGPTPGEETITITLRDAEVRVSVRDAEVRVSVPVDAAGAVSGEIEKTAWEQRRGRR